MRESSKESSGVPLDSNLCTNPEPGSAKSTRPMVSAAKATGISSFPGSFPLSPHVLTNSNGGGGGGFGAGSVRFAQETAHVAISRTISRRPRRDLNSGIVQFLPPNNTTSIRNTFWRGNQEKRKAHVVELRKSGIGTLFRGG